MSRRKGPPRYVPTLTEVVQSAPLLDTTLIDAVASADISTEKKALMVQRVLQRTDFLVARHLHETIEPMILAHTQALRLRLREEVALVVRESVIEAFEQEYASYSDLAEGLPGSRA